jgi:hypothetical protein
MAKMFYSAAEAAEKLGTTEDGVKDLVKEGKLREFRDAGKVNYKVDEVDKMASSKKPASGGSSIASALSDSSGGSGAEIILEPAEDSSIEIAGGSDILSLEELESDSGGTSAGTTAGRGPKKGDSVVASVGVNVFDDDDIDEQVDPLAQTAVTDMAGLGLEGSGGGSGIMDLTRESDDTSLGQELLDEIYTDTPKTSESADTKAGLEAAAAEPGTVDEDAMEVAAPAARTGAQAPSMAAIETVSDPVASGLTAVMVVAVAVLWFAGLGAAAMVRGITPALLQWVYDKLMFAAIGALAVGIVAAAVTYLLAKRSSA